MLKKKIDEIFNIGGTRPWLFAIGFYLFCCLAGMGLMLIIGHFTPPPRNLAEEWGMLAGRAAVVSIVPYISIIRRYKTWRPPFYLAGIAASFIMGMIGGIFCGFIPVAVTLAKKPLPK